MLAFPSPMLIRLGGPSYADFQAHIATLSVNGSVAWSSNPPGSPGNRKRTTAAAATGSMFGSSWLSTFDTFSTLARAIQHGLPSEAAFDAQVANGREIYFQLGDGGFGPYAGLDRNGYESASGGGGLDEALAVTDLIYWDGSAAQRMNPSAGTGPTPYVF